MDTIKHLHSQRASGQEGLVPIMVSLVLLALVAAAWEFGSFALMGALVSCVGGLFIVLTLVEMTLVQLCRYLWIWTLTVIFPYVMFSGLWKGRDNFLIQVVAIGVAWFYFLILLGKVKAMRSAWK